jgi:hypothetical protein
MLRCFGGEQVDTRILGRGKVFYVQNVMSRNTPIALFTDGEKSIDESRYKPPLVLLQLRDGKEYKMVSAVKMYTLHNGAVAAFFEFHKIGSLNDRPLVVYLRFGNVDAGVVLKIIPEASVRYCWKQIGRETVFREIVFL